jgi:SAM-dependent methyltransferase
MQLYDQLADWWPLLSDPADYAEEAAEYLRLLGDVHDVLELGAGGGNNASHMKKALELTLVEPSEGMRRMSQKLNPECTHLEGDMRRVRLGRTFDAVFVHDAICYMTTEADLRAALETVAIHLRPGGVAVVAPDDLAESYQPSTEQGGHDGAGAEGRSLRYLEWNLPAEGSLKETHYILALRERDGSVRVIDDRHLQGLFPLATWLRLFDEVGLTATLEERRLSEGVFPAFRAVKR